jgi:hypothetical protein
LNAPGPGEKLVGIGDNVRARVVRRVMLVRHFFVLKTSYIKTSSEIKIPPVLFGGTRGIATSAGM